LQSACAALYCSIARLAPFFIGVTKPAFSGESEAANPIFEQANLPAITPSATRPSLSDKGWKIFHRGVGNDFSQGPAAGNYIKNVLKAEKVFLVKDDSAYGLGLADEAQKVLGSLIVGTDTVKTGDKLFNTLVTKITGSGATAVFYGGYTAEASPLLKQLRAAGWKGTFVGGDGINDANMLSATGKADVEGTIATCPCGDPTKAKGTFVADYTAKYGSAPGVYADVSYDLANVYLQGLADGKSTRADLQAWVTAYNKTGEATGVNYKWAANGELDPAPVKVLAFKAVNGAWVADQEITG
jgi:branched-chain amino acid transport system substrate-binding protein